MTGIPMTIPTRQHFLTGTEFPKDEIVELLDFAETLHQERRRHKLRKDLAGKHLFLLFDKPSLRTRLSFTVAMNELGGQVIESVGNTRKKEEPQDLIRVLAGYGHAVMIRTHAHKDLDVMVEHSTIPVINGLSDDHHPCQGLADLLTLKQRFGSTKGLKLTYLGDGNNILHSLLMLAPQQGVHLHYCCPPKFQPSSDILNLAKARLNKKDGGSITCHESPKVAVHSAHALYTDVWTSMGFEKEEQERLQAFQGFQLNEELLDYADPKAIVLHCMPMVRGQEISETLPDHPRSAIFQQSANRLHVQKALLVTLIEGR